MQSLNDSRMTLWFGKFYKLMSPLCEFASSFNCFIVSVAFVGFVKDVIDLLRLYLVLIFKVFN